MRVNQHTVYRMIRRRQIPAFRFGRNFRFRRADIELGIETHRATVADDTRWMRNTLDKATDKLDKTIREVEAEADRVAGKSRKQLKTERRARGAATRPRPMLSDDKGQLVAEDYDAW